MASSLYGNGPFQVEFVKIDSAEEISLSIHERHVAADPNLKPAPQSPPRALIVAVPTAAGLYPVVVLQHGFMLRNDFYTQLMEHVASHGYIVVAPRMYEVVGPDATAEINGVAAIINWLPSNLAASLPEPLSVVRPDLQRLVLSGHSRGGKVAFGVALGKAKSPLDLKLSGLAAFDPVDGISNEIQTSPHIVSDKPHSFKLDFPTLIVGTYLGSQKISSDSLLPACAPENFGHKAFYFCSSSPTYHFVAAEFGHMDFLNDDTPGAEGTLSKYLCKNGPSRAPLRNFAGGILVAFLRAALLHDSSALTDVLKNPNHASIRLSTAESYIENLLHSRL